MLLVTLSWSAARVDGVLLAQGWGWCSGGGKVMAPRGEGCALAVYRVVRTSVEHPEELRS